jgi:hypothetical protein
MRSASIVTRRLTTAYMTVCATPAYLAQHGTPTRPEHLAEHPCLSRPSEHGGEERVFTGPDGEVRVRPINAIAANNTEMLRQFALLGMGVAILPSYLIGRDLASGRLVRLLGEYRLPQIEITIAYPSRLHLPAKVRTFIDHLVEHFQQPGQQAASRDSRIMTADSVVANSLAEEGGRDERENRDTRNDIGERAAATPPVSRSRALPKVSRTRVALSSSI